MSEPPESSAPFVTASHAVLFEEEADHRCDVCAEKVREEEGETDEPEEGFGVQGRGLLVWARGEERRYQEPRLCHACAAAIGVSALQRWEIEEEEG
jgi:hypothetical protein